MASSRSTFLFVAVLFGVFFLGCDQVSAPTEPRPPTVYNLEVVPDSVRLSDLPPNQVQDSSATVGVRLATEARDPDGSVERVVFTVEPATNPRGTATGSLAPAESTRYERDIGLGVPLVDEVYTIRVFAVDNDSLASNQAVGQFRVIDE